MMKKTFLNTSNSEYLIDKYFTKTFENQCIKN